MLQTYNIYYTERCDGTGQLLPAPTKSALHLHWTLQRGVTAPSNDSQTQPEQGLHYTYTGLYKEVWLHQVMTAPTRTRPALYLH